MATGDEILAMKKSCEEMKSYQTPDCPNCGWTLEKNKDGLLHCEFCGWIART